MKTSKRLLLLIGGLLLSLSAWALELDQAKAQGLVGEQLNGYLGVVTAHPSGEVNALLRDINTRRRQAYERIARENGLSLEQVASLAGKKAIEKTPPGQYIQDPATGNWLRR